MSTADAAAIRAERKDWTAEHKEMYLKSGGAKGHIMDLDAVGGHGFTTHCLIRFKGRKSGKVMITPLIYGDIGGEIVVCASKGGADEHPAWYLNLTAGPQIDVQVGTQAFRCTWREPESVEREKVWAFMQDVFPSYTRYQQTTDRVLPLVMMKPIEGIPVFGP